MQDRYQEIYQGHNWAMPQRFNMAWACCGRHALDLTAAPTRQVLGASRRW